MDDNPVETDPPEIELTPNVDVTVVPVDDVPATDAGGGGALDAPRGLTNRIGSCNRGSNNCRAASPRELTEYAGGGMGVEEEDVEGVGSRLAGIDRSYSL